MTTHSRRDPYSWTVVRLPDRDLAEVVLELAAPLLERLGREPTIDDARVAVALAVTFWNASVLASKRWEHPRIKELNDLRRRMRGRQAAPRDAATFDLLTERWRALARSAARRELDLAGQRHHPREALLHLVTADRAVVCYGAPLLMGIDAVARELIAARCLGHRV